MQRWGISWKEIETTWTGEQWRAWCYHMNERAGREMCERERLNEQSEDAERGVTTMSLSSAINMRRGG